jgi:hypothetical protein
MGGGVKIGDMVHYVSYGTPGGEYTSQCRAAVVVGIPGPGDPDSRNTDNPLDLVVLNPTGMFFNRCNRGEDDQTGGTWHLMEACRG